jgi:hypothetical protein
MPFTASLEITQSLDCTTMSVHDNSDYTTEGHGTFASRSLYITNAYGQTLDADGLVTETPTEIPFAFADYPSDIINIPMLVDSALFVRLTLVSNAPQSGSVYVYEHYYLLACQINSFAYKIIRDVSANRRILSDRNFAESLQSLYNEIDNADTAIKYSDISSAQAALDRANTLQYFQLKNF